MTKYSVPQASEELGAAVRPALPDAPHLAAGDEANPADLHASAGDEMDARERDYESMRRRVTEQRREIRMIARQRDEAREEANMLRAAIKHRQRATIDRAPRVPLRIVAAVDAAGKWAAYGATDLDDKDALAIILECVGDGERRYIITAELSPPNTITVPALSVDACEMPASDEAPAASDEVAGSADAREVQT